MTINGKTFEIQKITGYSKEVRKLTGNLRELKNTTEEIKMPEIQKPKIEQQKFKITGYKGNVKEFETPRPDTNSFDLWDTLKNKIEQIKPAIQQFKQKLNSVGGNRKELELVKYKISEIEEKLEKAKNGKIHLNTKEIIEAEAELERLNNKKDKLEKGGKGNFFSGFFSSLKKITPSMNNISGITIKIKNQIQQWGTGIRNGLGQVLKYAGALFSLQSIYSTLSGAANTWLSSQNAGAKQLSANIDYMKYAMGSAFAPVIQYVTGLVYQLMKAIQSVVYALFKVNIFAKASASSYASMAGSAKKAKNETKSLSNIHSEINNVSDSNNSDSGNDTTSPSFDLSGIDNQMSPLSQKLYDFFKPLADSWNKYGPNLVEQIKTTTGQIGGLISSVWGSFEKIITNGTVYTSLELILAIIGNIAEAFANAWNYNGNGDAIVQNLANAFNNLLTAINNVVQSEGFQNWLNNCSDKLRVISEKIASINWQPLIDALADIGEGIGTLALDMLSGLIDIFKWLVENPAVVELLIGIAIAIGLISTAIGIWNAVQAVWDVLMAPATLTIMLIVGAIVALIAIVVAVVEVIKNWGTISEWLGQKFEEAKQAITNAFQNIGEWFSDRWNDICNAFSDVGNWFKDKFNEAKEGVQTAFQNIGNWFGDRKKDITNTFSNIGSWFKGKFQDAYNGIKNVFSNIGNFFNGIWNGIKNTFSALGTKIGDAIGGAVKSGINGVISLIERTINSAIRLINGGIGMINLIPGVSVGTINTLNLPRLAKGNVAYDETLAIFGEYSGASNNPEITTPQNIMRDTFEDVLSDFNGNNGQPLHVTIQYLGKEIFDDTIDYINSKTRRTGKNTIVTVGD